MARASRQMQEALAELESRGATIIAQPESANEALMILRDIGPQRVGGRYHCGYWRQTYTVQAIEVDGWRWRITVRWQDGSTTTHSTRWDYRRDSAA